MTTRTTGPVIIHSNGRNNEKKLCTHGKGKMLSSIHTIQEVDVKEDRGFEYCMEYRLSIRPMLKRETVVFTYF